LPADESLEVQVVDPEHKKYDNPEPPDETSSRALMIGIGAVVVVVLMLLIATGKVQFG